MSTTAWIVFGVVMVVLIAACIILYFLGKRADKKRSEQEAQIAAHAQQCTMLIIDKKQMRLKDSGLPQAVIDQTPKLMRRSKVPVVKCKVGPQVMTMIADEKIFDQIPVKTQVKATVSGIYITEVRGMRGPLPKVEKKKGFKAKMADLYTRTKAKAEGKEPEPAKSSNKKKK